MTSTPLDPNEFIDVYSVRTGRKQRVPRLWLEDPVQGSRFRKTPSQRELDGELGPRPREESTVEEIEEYAEQAGIALPGKRATKTDKLTAIEAVFGNDDVQPGMVPAPPPEEFVDPLAPELVAQSDNTPPAGPAAGTADGAAVADTAPTDSDDAGSSGQSPAAAGNEEN